MVRDVVIRIHGDGALEGADGELSFAFFLEDFAEKNVWAGRGGVEPDGALEKFFGLVEFLQAAVGVGEFVISDGIAGVQDKFLFELRGCFGNFGLVKVEFAEELVGEGKLGIELDRFFAVLFGDGAEIETEQKARGEKISGRGIGGNLKHFGEGGASSGVTFGLDVGDAENVGGVNAGAGKP